MQLDDGAGPGHVADLFIEPQTCGVVIAAHVDAAVERTARMEVRRQVDGGAGIFTGGNQVESQPGPGALEKYAAELLIPCVVIVQAAAHLFDVDRATLGHSRVNIKPMTGPSIFLYRELCGGNAHLQAQIASDVEELALLAVGRGDHFQRVAQRHLAEDGRKDRVAVFVMREFIKHRVAGIAARRARVARERNDAAPVRKGYPALNRIDAAKRIDEIFVGDHLRRATHELADLRARLYEFDRLGFRGGEHCRRASRHAHRHFDAAVCGGKGVTDARGFHRDFEAGIVVDPALLIRPHLQHSGRLGYVLIVIHERSPVAANQRCVRGGG